MGEDVKIEVIRTTQNSLSKFIKKPPLTEKLLKKPPFRYLHDITTAVMKETGYLQGLYSPDELNPENIKDREAKIAFLEKLIAVVNLSTGVNIAARPNKIVAGLDVTKTNELLQAIANALENNIDSSKAVEQVLHKKSTGVKQQNSTKKENSKSKAIKEGKAAETKNREPRNTDALKKKPKEVKSPDKSELRKGKLKKDISPTKLSKTPSVEKFSAVENKNYSEPQQQFQGIPTDLPANISDEPVVPSDPGPEPNLDVKSPPSPPPPAQEPPEELIKVRDKTADTNKEPDINKKEEAPKHDEEMRRPQSARAIHRRKPATRKPVPEVNKEDLAITGDVAVNESKNSLEKKQVNSGFNQSEGGGVAVRETKRPRTAARPASARPGAPRVRDRGTVLLPDADNKVVSEPINVIVDSQELAKDDDETLVKVEAPLSEVVVDQVVVDESHLQATDQGHLVSQILETQKELEDTALLATTSEPSQKVDISWGGRERQQEAVTKEVERLRSAIQALTRAANPLGQLIDFLQEDVEAMQTELETWQKTNQQLASQLHAEERLTEESIEPLAKQLEDMNQLVEEQLEETSVVKAAILRNDDRISKLLLAGSAHRPH